MKKFWLMCLMTFLTCGQVNATDWPQFLGNTSLTAKSTETLEPPLTVKWTYETGDKIISSVSIKDGRVFFGSRDNTFNVVNEADGNEIWTYTANNWIDASAFIDDTHVYFASKDGYIYKLKAEDGTLEWKYNAEGTNLSSPIVSNSVVIAGAGFPQKEIIGIDANTGAKLWTHETGQMAYSTASVDGDNVFIGANDGKIYKLNKNTGEKAWEFKTKGGVYYASPSINNNTIYIAPGKSDWKTYAINADDGSLIWEFTPDDAQSTPTYVSSVAIGNDELYFVSGYSQQHLYCLNESTGSLKWKAALGAATRYGFSSTPVLTDNTVYVATSTGQLKAFEIGTGNLMWEHDLGAAILSSPSIANGTLYVGTFDGKVYAFE